MCLKWYIRYEVYCYGLKLGINLKLIISLKRLLNSGLMFLIMGLEEDRGYDLLDPKYRKY